MVASVKGEQVLTHLNRGTVGHVAGFTDKQIASKLLAMGVLPGSRLRSFANLL